MPFLLLLVLLTFFLPSPSAASPKDKAEAIQKRQSAVELFEAGKYGEAAALLEEVLVSNPDDAKASRYLLMYKRQVAEPFCKKAADAYLIGNYPEAIGLWEEILRLNPSERRVRRLIEETSALANLNAVKSIYAEAEKALKEGRQEAAVAEIEKILGILPGDKQAVEMLKTVNRTIADNLMKEHYNKADSYLKQAQYDKAISEWEQVLKIDPSQELASGFIASTFRMKFDEMYAKAHALYEAGDYISSRNVYQNILANNPTDPNIKKTIEKLNRVINIVPNVSETGKSWDMLRKGLSHYISSDGNPRVSIAAVWYSNQLEQNNLRIQTVKVFLEKELNDTLLTLDPPVAGMNMIDQYLFTSLNHIYEGRYDLAILKSGVVLELEPNNVLALKRLGSAYFAMGRKDKAVEVWQRALKIDPNDKELKEYISRAR